MKILVVEDDAILRRGIGSILKASGNDVIEAATGEAAIAAVQAADELGLILMDMRMPGLGGAQACTAIRAMPGWRGRVQIKAMSGLDFEALSTETKAPFDGFVKKGPDFFESLQAVVSDAVAKAVPPPADPPRATLVAWLKLNLLTVVTMFISFISFAVAGIWAASAWNSDLRHDVADQKRINAAQDIRLDQDHIAMVDVDRRLNEARRDAESAIANARRETETDLAAARRETDASFARAGADVAVLKAQMQFLADRAPTSAPLPTGARR